MDAIATITGHAAEPELRYTQGGAAVCSFSVAVRRAFKRNDEWEEVVTWWRVNVWNEYGEHVAQSVHKGTRVTCTGYPEIEEWEGKDGSKGKTLVLRADEVAVNLKWATAETTKVEREDRSGNRTTSTGAGGRAARAPQPAYTSDEEPFADLGERFDGYKDGHLWL